MCVCAFHVQADFTELVSFVKELKAPWGTEKKKMRQHGVTIQIVIPPDFPIGDYCLMYCTDKGNLIGISEPFPVNQFNSVQLSFIIPTDRKLYAQMRSLH
jgi:hypothetical protein